MPNIRTYENQVGLQPDDRAARSTAIGANTIRGAYDELGREIGSTISVLGQQYVQVRATQQISQGLAESANIQQGLSTEWNQTVKTADPNNPAVAAQFQQERLEPALEEWVGTFDTAEGKRWAEGQAARLRQHFFEKTAADQATLAGAAAVQNLEVFKNGLSNSALQDPTAVPMILGTLEAGLNAVIQSNPNIDAATGTRIRGELLAGYRKEVVQSGFIGMARNNPDAAMEALQKGYGGQDLDAIERNKLFGFAEDIKRQRASDDRAQAQAARQAQKDDFNAKVALLSSQMFGPDGSLRVPQNFHQQLALLGTHAGADDGAIRALGDAAARATTSQIEGTFQRTNAAAWRDLSGRIGLPPGHPQALTEAMVDRAYANSQLSNQDYSFLRRAASPQGDPATKQAMTDLDDTLKRLKPLVDKSNLYTMDQSGIDNYNTLVYDTNQRYQQLVAGGLSPAEAVKVLSDPRDPRSVRNNLARYQTSNKEGLQNILQRTKPEGGPQPLRAPPAAATGRKPGETPEQYLQRMGSK